MESTVTPTPSSPAKRPGYGQLLRTHGAWTFLLPGFLARQPFAMLSIGIILLIEDTSGSYGTAGTVAAAAGLSMALFAPVTGKLADRYGQTRVLLPSVLVHVAAVSLLTSLALADAPFWALIAAAVPTGASIPQIGPMVRARWAATLKPGSPLQQTAAAFESVTDEFTFVVGPVLAAALATGVHPAAGLIAEAGLTLTGGLLFAFQRRTAPPVVPAQFRHKKSSALRVPGVRVLAVTFFGIGSVFGGMTVSLTAFTEEIGQPGMNGALYGVFAAGNMLAGLAVGAIHWRRSPQWRLLLAYPLLVAAAAALWLISVTAPYAGLLGLLGLLVGICIAPALITGFTLVDPLVPASARTEAFTWLTGAVALGQAAGAAAAGQLADGDGSSAGFLVPLAGTGLAATLLLLRRKNLYVPGSGRVWGGASGAVEQREPVSVD